MYTWGSPIREVDGKPWDRCAGSGFGNFLWRGSMPVSIVAEVSLVLERKLAERCQTSGVRASFADSWRLASSIFHVVSGLPQLLQNRAAESFCAAPQEAQVTPACWFAPQVEQNADPAVLAAPQVPQRPGSGGT